MEKFNYFCQEDNPLGKPRPYGRVTLKCGLKESCVWGSGMDSCGLGYCEHSCEITSNQRHQVALRYPVVLRGKTDKTKEP